MEMFLCMFGKNEMILRFPILQVWKYVFLFLRSKKNKFCMNMLSVLEFAKKLIFMFEIANLKK